MNPGSNDISSYDVDSWFASTANGNNDSGDDNDGLVIPPHYFPTPKRTGNNTQ